MKELTEATISYVTHGSEICSCDAGTHTDATDARSHAITYSM